MFSDMTVRELLYWSYANLSMAHYSMKRGERNYTRRAYFIRKQMYSNYMDGSMKIGTFFDDEKIKMKSLGTCSYCGLKARLSLDHVIPRARTGKDTGDNLVYACKSCNSSKCNTDLMEWIRDRQMAWPIMVIR